LTTCDPYELRCYNSDPDRTWCKIDDDCGIISLLAACDKSPASVQYYHNQNRFICFDATYEMNKLDNNSAFYFLSSFNLYKGMLMTATYNPSLDIPPNGKLTENQ
jgi:hypothetical protein